MYTWTYYVIDKIEKQKAVEDKKKAKEQAKKGKFQFLFFFFCFFARGRENPRHFFFLFLHYTIFFKKVKINKQEPYYKTTN